MGRKDGILMDSRGIKDTSRKGTSKRDRLYKIADRTWTIAGWIWSIVIIGFLVAFAAGLAASPDSTNNFNTYVLRWLSTLNLIIRKKSIA
jgi:hypothetical protein